MSNNVGITIPESRRLRSTAIFTLVVLVAIVLVSGWRATPARAQITPAICSPQSGVVLIWGFTLTYQTHLGRANHITVEHTGGTYTEPGQGVPLTSQTYRITDSDGFSDVETRCATDTAASCVRDPADSGVVTCTAILSNLEIVARDGENTVDLAGVPAPASISGGDGIDILRGGENADVIGLGDGRDEGFGGNGRDQIFGGPLGDFIDGGADLDEIHGGDGDDTIHGGAGQDTLDGGGHIDTLDYSDVTVPVTVDLSAAASGSALVGPAGDKDAITNTFESVRGGEAGDTITGNSGKNYLNGGPGPDRIDGGLSDDEIDGAEGDDRISDPGSEKEFGGAAEANTFRGGDGNDWIVNSFGDDELYGGDGNDRLVAKLGQIDLHGEEGDDWLIAGCDPPGLFGARVENLLDGGNGDDTFTAAPCPGVSQATSDPYSRDTYVGGDGFDTVDFCAANASAARDFARTLPGSFPNRPLANEDWGKASSCGRTLAQRISIGDGSPLDPRDGVLNEDDVVTGSVEAAIGGAGPDTLVGSSGANYLNGATGSDRLFADNGNDTLNGGPGGPEDTGDLLDGGDFTGLDGGSFGVDTIDLSNRSSGVEISIDGIANDGAAGEADKVEEDVENVVGGLGDDVLTGDGDANTLEGGPGEDTLRGEGGADVLVGGFRDDILEGGGGFDIFDAGGGDDTVRSRDGANEGQIDCGSEIDTAVVDRGESPANCEKIDSGVTGSLPAGGTISTDVEGDGATPSHPVEAQVTTPNPGEVDVKELQTTTPSPTGYQILGTELKITAPAGSAESPLVITFRIDASQVPPGQGPLDIVVYRNGVPVPDCHASPPRVPGRAEPDPCIAARSTLADGDVQIVVLTSSASAWSFAFDVAPPAISILTPPQNATYFLHEVVLASYSCADDGSGVSSCAGTTTAGTAVDSASVGAKTFTVNAEDKSGNDASVTHAYRVIYRFDGFFSPLENPGHMDGVLNSVRAGAAVPVKFSLAGDQGVNILATNSPHSQQMGCADAVTTDPVEETVTANASGLKYDSDTATYTYIWKTNNLWAGTCRRLNVRLNDGTDHFVDFKFLK